MKSETALKEMAAARFLGNLKIPVLIDGKAILVFPFGFASLALFVAYLTGGVIDLRCQSSLRDPEDKTHGRLFGVLYAHWFGF